MTGPASSTSSARAGRGGTGGGLPYGFAYEPAAGTGFEAFVAVGAVLPDDGGGDGLLLVDDDNASRPACEGGGGPCRVPGVLADPDGVPLGGRVPLDAFRADAGGADVGRLASAALGCFGAPPSILSLSGCMPDVVDDVAGGLLAAGGLPPDTGAGAPPIILRRAGWMPPFDDAGLDWAAGAGAPPIALGLSGRMPPFDVVDEDEGADDGAAFAVDTDAGAPPIIASLAGWIPDADAGAPPIIFSRAGCIPDDDDDDEEAYSEDGSTGGRGENRIVAKPGVWRPTPPGSVCCTRPGWHHGRASSAGRDASSDDWAGRLTLDTHKHAPASRRAGPSAADSATDSAVLWYIPRCPVASVSRFVDIVRSFEA